MLVRTRLIPAAATAAAPRRRRRISGPDAHVPVEPVRDFLNGDLKTALDAWREWGVDNGNGSAVKMLNEKYGSG